MRRLLALLAPTPAPLAAVAAVPARDRCAVLVCPNRWTETVGPDRIGLCTGHAVDYR